MTDPQREALTYGDFGSIKMSHNACNTIHRLVLITSSPLAGQYCSDVTD